MLTIGASADEKKSAGALFSSRLLKKTHMLRCAQSHRVNVLPMYASARRFSRAWPLDLFEQPARGGPFYR
jgi:hypothetical protein